MSKTKHRRSPMRLKTTNALGQPTHKGSLTLRMKPSERYAESKVESGSFDRTKSGQRFKNGKRKTKSKKSRERVEPEHSSTEEIVSEETPKRESSPDSKKKKQSKKISKKKTKSKESIWPAESEEISSEEDDRVPSKKQQRKSSEAKKKKKRTKSKNDKKTTVEPAAERGSQEPWSDRRFSDNVPPAYTSHGPQERIEEGIPTRPASGKAPYKEGSPSLHMVGSRGSQRKSSPSLHEVGSRGSPSLHKVGSRGSQRKSSPSLHKVDSRGSQRKSSPSLHKVGSRGSLKDPSSTSHKSHRSESLKESSLPSHEVDSRKTDKDEAKRAKENLEKKYRSMKIIFRDPRTKKEIIVIIDDEDDGQVSTGQAFFPQQQSPKQTALSTQDLPEDQDCPSGNAELIIRLHKDDKNHENSKQEQHPSTNNKPAASEIRSGKSTAEDKNSKNHPARRSRKSGQTIRESGTYASIYPHESISKHSRLSNEKLGFKSPSINEDTNHKNKSHTNSESLQPEVCKCMQNMEERGVNTIYNAHFSSRFPPCFRKVCHPSVTLTNNDLYINNKHDQYKICNGYDGKLRLNNLKLLKGRNDMNSDNSSECSFISIKHAYNRNLGYISDNHLILNEVYLKTTNENVKKKEKNLIKNINNKEEDTKLYEEIGKSKNINLKNISNMTNCCYQNR